MDDPVAARVAGADALSLAWMQARNHTLRWLAAFEASTHGPLAPAGGLPGALWLAGHAAWWAEAWICRNVHAQRGEHADAGRPRLASIEPQADAALGPEGRDAACAGAPRWDDAAAVRAYMAETMDAALELLARADGSDDSLHFPRLALWHEDRCGEALAALAEAAGLVDGPWPDARARAPQAPLWMPAARWMLGSTPGGFVPEAERWAHPVAVPDFEIDAQPVGWARFAEFAEDGGYDDRQWWHPDAWAWLQTDGRRAPRGVEQLRHGVVRMSRGRLQRMGPGQAAVHVTRHEAEAWCRWAGRRLPTEPEWELAACSGGSRGFSWGQVLEWVAGSGRPWPGHASVAGDLDPVRPGAAVLRGASTATPARAAHLRARRFVAATDDVWPTGFRSCAL